MGWLYSGRTYLCSRNLGALRVEWPPSEVRFTVLCTGRKVRIRRFLHPRAPAPLPTNGDLRPTKHGVEATIFLASLNELPFFRSEIASVASRLSKYNANAVRLF